jgi:hypothetical protein
LDVDGLAVGFAIYLYKYIPTSILPNNQYLYDQDKQQLLKLQFFGVDEKRKNKGYEKIVLNFITSIT